MGNGTDIMLRVATFYRFTPLEDPQAVAERLRAACARAGVRGTVILASEGINGTLAGPPADLDAALAALRAVPGCADLSAQISGAPDWPFARLKVVVRPEVVTFGGHGAADLPAGRRVAPRDWEAAISAPDVVLIDTRNTYEIAAGTFRGALDPGTESFTDFAAWWAEAGPAHAGKRVAMFCTGGIRCEKASRHLRASGVADVLQLEGGILAYLADPPADSSWQGACFVFDGRVTLGPGLVPGPHVLCHACGGPVSPEDQLLPGYEAGVSCPACFARYDAASRARFRERQRQMMRAAPK